MNSQLPNIDELEEQPLIITVDGDKYTIPSNHLKELEDKYESLTSSKLKKLLKKLSI
jgi:hypothetical protein